LATYAVPPSLLEPRLPPGLALDLRDDSAFVYGPEWAFLADAQPVSIMVAVGSPVSVWPKQH
jgi:hypothetical protein